MPVEEAEPFFHTALHCLVAIAGHHGLTSSVERLVHEHALPASEPEARTLVRIAEGLGFKSRATTLDWQELVTLDGVYPVMVRLKNGNSVVVAGHNKMSEAVAIFDPMTPQLGIFLLEKERFLEAWSKEVLFFKRLYKLTDEEQPFSLRWFVPELLRQKRLFMDVAFAAVLLIILALATPIFFQLVIDKVLVHQNQSTLTVLTVGIGCALLFEAVFSVLRQYLLLFATSKIDIRLSSRTFSHLLSLPIDYFEATSAGVTVRHLQQVEKIRQFLTGRLFLTLLDASALLVFVPLLAFYSAKLTLVTMAFALVIAGVIFALLGPFRRALRDLYQAEAEQQAVLVETISGMRTIKSSAIEPFKQQHWNQRAAQAVLMRFNVGQIAMVANTLVQFLEKVMVIAVIVVGAGDVFDQVMTVGALVAFQMLSGRVVSPLVQIVALIQDYQETALSVRMLATVMNHPPESRHQTSGLTPEIKGRIEFDKVTFRYPNRPAPAIDRLSLLIPAGGVLGVVGKSGSGKTSLTRLIQGLYAIQEGIIRIDGVDLREIELPHLRRQIGVVLQDNFLFRGTIRENIAVTKPDATLQEIVTAAQSAGAVEFIEKLPQGYATPLEENAANLSGGQKQRLAIARALLPNPAILILDEATSALDPESEVIVFQNLEKIAAGRTVIIVSHRLNTLVRCQGIAYMEEGRIQALAPHAVLLEKCAPYRQLWELQNKR
ncbi:MAG: peptidase domain-containing ABC transporter [Magnetococcales bacterium]|nr:peptidase domain-containing ABC transporter [Magnetococcales bacterium]NGZ06496.1 peptidase domain-containing ABC transporter [Magnetococcales bacterium]